MWKYVRNYIILECFALNKNTFFKFGKGWRGRQLWEDVFPQAALGKNAIAQRLNGLDLT